MANGNSDLVISVGANIQQLERQLKASAKAAEQAAKDIEDKFNKVNPSISTSALTGALKGLGAAFTLDKIIRGLAEANTAIAALGDQARKAGIEVQRFQELRSAAGAKGIEGKSFDSGLGDLAAKLSEARRQENDLTEFLKLNNVEYKNRRGEVVSTNEALAIAADLISRAGSEADKIEIAKQFGLPADFVPLLENGAEALNKLAKNAREAGGIIDDDVIAAAKKFDADWNAAWNSFSLYSRSAIGTAIAAMGNLRDQAAGFFEKMEQGRKAGAQLGQMIGAMANGATPVQAATLPPSRPPGTPVSAPYPPARPQGLSIDPVRFPDKKSGGGGGGGGGGKEEDEKAQDRLDRYIESLVRKRAVMDAEIATVGKSNAEKQKAIEIARAGVDLEKLGTAEKAKYIEKLSEEVGKNEEVRASRDKLQQAQKGMIEAQQYLGNAAVDALEDLIINGEKAEDVIKNLTKSLAKAALQALLMGNGPLAGLFGTSGTNGEAGGLFGAVGGLFKRADGGPVNAGQAYTVGERGRETFVPMSPGKIIPNSKMGSGAGSVAISIDVSGATGNAEIQRMVSAGISQGIQAYDGHLNRSILNKFQRANARFG